ncbi:MAG: SAM-dependent chlorinase/fluorinase [bacterium]
MLKPPIALITDFGPGSYHVGAMKGVINSIHPDAVVIDVTHDIAPFNIIEAMYVLDSVFSYFPAPTIFLVVVDPGVGSSRRPLLATGEKAYYICPDNGILSRVLKSDSISRVIHIEEEHYMLPDRSHTFEGRDVFAPCAAWLSKTFNADNFGDPIDDYLVMEPPKVRITADRTFEATVLFTDRFGNLVTNFEKDFLVHAREKYPGNSVKLMLGSHTIPTLSNCYSDVQNPGDLVAYFGGMNLLEIGMRESNARENLNVKPGDTVTINLGE